MSIMMLIRNHKHIQDHPVANITHQTFPANEVRLNTHKKKTERKKYKNYIGIRTN